MVRRIVLLFSLITALLGISSVPACAQSGRTFFIDYNSGSNSNNGTSKNTSWKTHPYMQTSGPCTGTGSAAYSHQAGDKFIFKGGVTWPSACFPLNITSGGSGASTPDLYTVDQTWFNGGSFTRPIFAGQNATMPFNAAVAGQAMVAITASNVTMGTSTITGNGFDIGGQNLGTYGAGHCGSYVVAVAAGLSNVIVTQSILHDWIVTSSSQNVNYNHSAGGMCYGTDGNVAAGKNIVLDHSEVRDDGNIISGTSTPWGVCGHDIVIQYSTCHYLFEGIVGFISVHDSEFANLNYPHSADSLNSSGAHLNVIESDGYDGDGPVYNNWIHDDKTYGEVIAVTGCNSTPVYNNVITNQAHYAIMMQPGAGQSSCTGFVANNIIDVTTTTNPGTAMNCAQYMSGATINGGNNICIVGGPTGGTLGSLNGAYAMSTSEASTYGFTAASKYFPHSSDPNVTGKGTDLTSLLSASLTASASMAALAYDTEGAPWFGGSPVARTSWDLGAYANAGQSSSKPNPPSGLAAIVQ